MLKTESMVTDVLVIGSGIAGMIAAIEARKAGAQVVLASKGALGKDSATSRARTFGMHADQNIEVKGIPGYDDKPGKYIEDQRFIDTLTVEAPRQLQNLISLGVPLVEIPPQSAYDRGNSWRPSGSETTHGGAIVLDSLVPVIARMGVKALAYFRAASLLKDGDRVVGASGLLHEDSWLSIHAKAIILATGGAAGISKLTTSTSEVMGNGYAMALKAGLTLRSMEFNGYYAVGLPTPDGRYVHCAPVTLMMENAVLLNDKGEDIVKKHLGISLQEAVPPPGVRFDWLPRAVAAEVEQGKVWLDLTRVPPGEWDNLPERNWKQIRQTRVDMKKTPLAIMPMAHHFYGGLIADTSMKTSLPGLYAAGEVVAGWRAERAHGNLPSCLAMGAIAGRNSASEIVNVKAPSQKVRDEGLEMAQALLSKDGKAKPEEVCEEIRDIVYRHNSPIKSKDSLEEGLKKLERLEKQTADMKCQNLKALREALEAKAMLLTSKAMLRSALLRAESRGAYYRRDFPARDDKNWLVPVLTSYDPKSGEVTVKKGEKIAPSSYRV